MSSTTIHKAVEITEVADKVSSGAEKTAKVAKMISGEVAFRKFLWLKMKPAMNIAGNLRGMVVNAKARTVYEFAMKGEEYSKNFSAFIAIAGSLVSVYDESVAIVQSKDDAATKAAKLSTQVTSASLRAITGLLVIPESLAIAQGISYVSGFGARHLPRQQDRLNNIRELADDFRSSVITKVQTFTDGNNIYTQLQSTVVTPMNRLYR